MSAETLGQITLVFKYDKENVGEGISGTPAAPDVEGRIDSDNPTVPKSGAKKIAALATVGFVAKQGLSYASSRVEMFTGSSSAQNSVNFAMKAVGYATAIAANPALGIAALAMEITTQAADYGWKKKWADAEAAEYSRVTGRKR